MRLVRLCGLLAELIRLGWVGASTDAGLLSDTPADRELIDFKNIRLPKDAPQNDAHLAAGVIGAPRLEARDFNASFGA